MNYGYVVNVCILAKEPLIMHVAGPPRPLLYG